MPRFLATLIFSLSLLIPTSFAAASKKPQNMVASPAIMRLGNGLQNLCTTWAVDTQMWITAAHCVLPETDFDMDRFTISQDFSPMVFQIDGQVADLVAADPSVDLAIMYTPTLAAIKPLQLAKAMPDIDSHALVIGFPQMWGDEPFDRPLEWDERVKAESVATHCSAARQMVLQGAALGGNSGSPILGKQGRVISVLQCAFGNGVVSGATWNDLVRFVAATRNKVTP